MPENPTNNKFNYPGIDPVAADNIEHLDWTELGKENRFAFYDLLLAYGIDSVLLLHFMSDLKEVLKTNEITVDQFLQKYGTIIDDPATYNVTSVSVKPFIEDGIYIPEIKKRNRLQLFNCDHLNRISCHSQTQIGDPEFLGICRRHWHKENFSDPVLVNKSITLAKDMWALNTIDLNRYYSEVKNPVPAPNPETMAAARSLIDYYWSIVEADGDSAPDRKRKWILHQANLTHEDQERGLIQRGVFVGTVENICRLLSKYELPQKHIEEIKADTRRKIVEIIRAKAIL